MKNVFFNEDIIDAERKIISGLKIPSIVLMENAGANSAKYINENFKSETEKEVIILCGKGNNAGDGFVIARHLVNTNVRVKVLMLYKESEIKGDALINYNILKLYKNTYLNIIYCSDEKSFKKEISSETILFIDAIFGIGFKGEADKRIEKIIEYINSLNIKNSVKNKTVISIDTPSCLNNYNFSENSSIVKADITLQMGVKKFHSLFYKGKAYSGKTELINIGVSEAEFTKENSNNIFETDISDIKKFLPERKNDSNKYTNGKVFVLSGSEGLTGATYLCSMSALRSGAGAVITGIPECINSIMEIKLTEVMTLPLHETNDKTLSLKSYSKIKEKLKWADAVLIGPGISKNEETMDLVRKIVQENDVNFVIDADAISAFKGKLNSLKNKKIIITPHFGEFASLIDVKTEDLKNNFYNYAKEFAKKYNIVLVLKNAPTIITDGDYFYINSTGKENLATVGTGDVLSGMITSLFSQTNNALQSAVAGNFMHGMCGDRLYEVTGNDFTIASDLINEIGNVKNLIRQFEN